MTTMMIIYVSLLSVIIGTIMSSLLFWSSRNPTKTAIYAVALVISGAAFILGIYARGGLP